MNIVYFGQKRPKTIRVTNQQDYAKNLMAVKQANSGLESKNISLIILPVDKTTDYIFEPFVQQDIPAPVAKKLLDNCGDIFFKVEIAERKAEEKPDHKPHTKGYVGDVPAERIKDLPNRIKKDLEKEKGFDLDEAYKAAKEKGELA